MKVRIYSDGACRSGGRCAAGVAVLTPNHDIVHTVSCRLPTGTSNQAEYMAFNIGLGWAHDRRATLTSAVFRLDSQVVAYQLTGEYACRDDNLRKLWEFAQQKLGDLRASGVDVGIEWVRRDFNQFADLLANQALDAR